jgi:hypothetical protein
MKDIEKNQSVETKAQLLVEMESSTAHFTAFLLSDTFTAASNALQEGEEPLAGTFLCDLSGTKAYEFYGNWRKIGEMTNRRKVHGRRLLFPCRLLCKKWMGELKELNCVKMAKIKVKLKAKITKKRSNSTQFKYNETGQSILLVISREGIDYFKKTICHLKTLNVH